MRLASGSRLSFGLAAVAVLLIGVPGWATPQDVSTGPQLVVNRDFPDPGVIQTPVGDYAYSSDGYYAGRLVNVPEATAASVTGPWTATGVDALPELPGWVAFDSSSDTYDVWAPDVTSLDGGGYLLYFVARDLNGLQCIGTATAADPVGPFTPVGDQPLLCGIADHGDIDPMAYSENGKHYLVYKDNANSAGVPDSIWVNEVAADGVTLVGGRTRMLTADAGGDEQNVAEAADLVRVDGQYVLLYSAENWDSTYHMKYAVSATLIGAYTKQGTFADTAAFDGSIVAPGGNYAVTAPDGSQYLFFHGNITGGRGLYVDQMTWPHGVPTLAGSSTLDGGTYRFATSGAALAVAGSDTWLVTPLSSGAYRIVSATSGLALAESHGRITLQSATGTAAQTWYVDRDFAGAFRITSQATGTLLTLSGSAPALAANTDTATQKWQPTAA